MTASKNQKKSKKSAFDRSVSASAQHDQAVELHHLGDWGEAEALCLQILAKAPGRAQTQHLLGLILLEQERRLEALVCFEKAFIAESSNNTYRFAYSGLCSNLGLAQLSTGDINQALSLLEKAASVYEDPRILNNLALGYLQQGRALLALEPLQKAIAQKPDYASAHYNMGLALRDIGQVDKAILSLRKATVYQRNFAEAHNNLGILLTQVGQISDAVSSFNTVLSLHPNSVDAYSNLGLCYFRQNQLHQSATMLEKALTFSPQNTNVLNNLAWVYLLIGKKDEAISLLTRTLNLDHEDARAIYLMAIASGVSPERAPANYVAELFDNYAHRFEQHLVESLAYSLPQLIADKVKSLASQSRFRHMLDLGCGTGLALEPIKHLVDRSTGIDLSANMIATAKNKAIYQNLIHGDVLNEIPPLSESFDLIVAADMLIYLGDLRAFFAAVAQKCSLGAYLIFSTENLDSGQDYALQTHGLFGHSPVYVKRLLEENQFSLLEQSSVNLRKSAGEWIAGILYVAVFQKTPTLAQKRLRGQKQNLIESSSNNPRRRYLLAQLALHYRLSRLNRRYWCCPRDRCLRGCRQPRLLRPNCCPLCLSRHYH